MRRQDWAVFAALGAAVLAVVAGSGGHIVGAIGWALLAGGAGAAARAWSRRFPGPMPHLIRWVLLLPRGPHAAGRLKAILEPRDGERVLEIGPGIGIHALPVASSLAPRGVLEVLDVQQEMLHDLERRAMRADVGNIVATCGDAQTLPYPDRTFDGAYLVGVLGEIPDQVAALRELRRVLRPSGRLVVGEVMLDPDYISPGHLGEKLLHSGFHLERIVGPSACYFALCRPIDGADGDH